MTRDVKNALTTLIVVGVWVAMCLVLSLFTGCTPAQYVARPMVLPTVAAPVLTPVKPTAFTCPLGVVVPAGWMCLSEEGYTTLVGRERKTWDWGAAEAAVINANNAKAKQ